MCLGAGISCVDGVDVQTTVDNRNLGASGTPALTVDGTAQPDSLGWKHTFANPGYVAIDGMGAYVFFGAGAVSAKRVASTGAWSSINSGYSSTPITRNYLTLWFDHGIDPTNGGYAYQLMPGATAAQAAARVNSPTVQILANTESVQAIKSPSLRTTMANFFTKGAAGPITVDAPCSVLVRQQGDSVTVAISDPGRTSSRITVTIDLPGYQTVTAGTGVTVTQTGKQITLVADVSGAMGASRTVTLSHAA
jgi:hyaluronate lyase